MIPPFSQPLSVGAQTIAALLLPHIVVGRHGPLVGIAKSAHSGSRCTARSIAISLLLRRALQRGVTARDRLTATLWLASCSAWLSLVVSREEGAWRCGREGCAQWVLLRTNMQTAIDGYLPILNHLSKWNL